MQRVCHGCRLLPGRLPELPDLPGEWLCLLQALSTLQLRSISETQQKGFLGRHLWRGSAVLVHRTHVPLLHGSLGSHRVNVYAGHVLSRGHLLPCSLHHPLNVKSWLMIFKLRTHLPAKGFWFSPRHCYPHKPPTSLPGAATARMGKNTPWLGLTLLPG